MFCTHCGAEIAEGSAFCSNCGQPVQAPASSQESAETIVENVEEAVQEVASIEEPSAEAAVQTVEDAVDSAVQAAGEPVQQAADNVEDALERLKAEMMAAGELEPETAPEPVAVEPEPIAEPVIVEPVVVEPEPAAEPVVPEPVIAEPEPVVSESVADPVVVEPAIPAPVIPEPVIAEPAPVAEPVVAEPVIAAEPAPAPAPVEPMPAVSPVVTVGAPAEPATYVQPAPAPQPTTVSPVYTDPTIISAPVAPDDVTRAAAPAPSAPQTASYVPSPVQAPAQQGYTPPSPVPAQAPGYSYQPAATAPAQYAATPKKSSPIAKIAIGAAVIALLGFLVFTFFGKGSGGGNSGGNVPIVTPTGDEVELFDSKGNPTLYAVTGLSGTEFVDAVEAEGFDWDDDRLWWVSADGNDALYVSGNNDYEFDRSEIAALDVNGEGTSAVYIVVVDDRDYASPEDAFDKLANIDVKDVEMLDDNFGLAYVTAPSGRDNFVIIDINEEVGLYLLNIFNEEAVASGLLAEYLGDDYGATVSEVWDTIFNESSDGSSSVEPPAITTAPAVPAPGNLAAGALGTIAPGSYVVGEGLPAGEYKLYSDPDTSGYYAVYPDSFSTEIMGIINNELFDSCCYVTVKDGQYVEFERCSLDPVASAKKTDEWDDDGIYKVGFDIPAGTLTLTPEDDDFSGFYAIYTTSDPAAMDDAIVNIDMFDEPITVTVSEGQYLSTSFCEVDIAQ